MALIANNYVDGQMAYFPEQIDEQTKRIVRFMIFEAYNEGYKTGFDFGKSNGKRIAIEAINEAIEKLLKL